MKAQTRTAALTESAVNIAAGIGLSTALNLALLPLVRAWPLWQATALMVAAFTAMSFVRSYILRRIFEHFRTRNTPPFFEDVIGEIAAERMRQIHGEGYSLAHDDAHDDCSLARGAAAYALAGALPKGAIESTKQHNDICFASSVELFNGLWPWALNTFKPTLPRRNLVKAAAMIVAEIGRLDRAHRRRSVP